MSDAPELLPCPFCGGKAELVQPWDGGRPYVACAVNYCTAPTHDKAGAIAAWNRRATPAASPEVQALIAEEKTQLVSLVGITAKRDIAIGEPLMWGDKDGDCLSPEIALQERFATLIRRFERIADEIDEQVSVTRAYVADCGMDHNQRELMKICTSHFLDKARAIRAEAAALRGKGE